MIMKLILTGVTGFIGGETLSQSLREPVVTSIVALSRRTLPGNISSPKLEVVLLKDFNSYPDSVLEKLSGADACIWCMGTTAGAKVREIDYPLVSVNAIYKIVQAGNKPFRYIHLSEAVSERDQTNFYWVKGGMRRTKGQAELNMLGFSNKEENKGLWETVIVEAGFVVTKEGRSPRDIIGWVLGSGSSIRVNELAVAMIDVAFHGSVERTIRDNNAMVMRGRKVLKA